MEAIASTALPELDLHPDTVPNDVMGDIFEELIRRFSEISNETAGEHFTPREVVRLCAELVLAGDEELLSTPGIVRSVYDPACGTGGMLSVVDELVRERNPKARLGFMPITSSRPKRATRRSTDTT